MPTYSVFPETYEVYKKDGTLRGGGVFIAVKNDLTTLEERVPTVVEDEIIWTSLQVAKSKKLYLSNYYRPPSTDTNHLGHLLDDSLGKVFSRAAKFLFVVLCRGFNCGAIICPELCLHENL